MLPFIRKNNYWKIECLSFSLKEDDTVRYIPIGICKEKHPYFINVNDEKADTKVGEVLSSRNVTESMLICNNNYICNIRYFVTHFELNIYRPYFVKKMTGFRSLFINIFAFELGLLECHDLINRYGKNVYSVMEKSTSKTWERYRDSIHRCMDIVSKSFDPKSSIGLDYILEEKYSLGRYWLESKSVLTEEEKKVLASVISYGLK